MEEARRGQSWGGKLLLLLASLLACFALLEIGLRILAPREEHPGGLTLYVASPNPRLVYELRPDHRVVREGILIRTNAAGFRGEGFVKEKPPGVFRIAVVGDSVTFGHRVEEEQAFSRWLERNLRRAGRSVEVLGFGVPGYNSLQEVELVRSRILDYDPDLLIVGYVLNDHKEKDPASVSRFFEKPWSRAQYWLSVRGRDLYRRFIWDVTSEAFEDLAQLAAERGLPVAVVVFPMMKLRDDGSYRYEDRREWAVQVARRVGFPTLDLFDAYAEMGFENAGVDRVHPSAAGHRLAAERIQAFLEREELLGP